MDIAFPLQQLLRERAAVLRYNTVSDCCSRRQPSGMTASARSRENFQSTDIAFTFSSQTFLRCRISSSIV